MEQEAALSEGACQGHSCLYQETAPCRGRAHAFVNSGRFKMIDLYTYQVAIPLLANSKD
jgi:hypothetical protein